VSFLRYFSLSCMATLLFVRAAAANSVILQENFNELTPRLTVTAVGSFSAVGGTNVDIVGGRSLETCAFRPNRETVSTSMARVG
jgi:hypothetical protein